MFLKSENFDLPSADGSHTFSFGSKPSRSSYTNIGASEIPTHEQQQEISPPGRRVSEDIVQVEARGMVTLPVAPVRRPPPRRLAPRPVA